MKFFLHVFCTRDWHVAHGAQAPIMNDVQLVDRFKARLVETGKTLSCFDILELRSDKPTILAVLFVGRCIETDEIVSRVADVVRAERVVVAVAKRSTVLGQVHGHLTRHRIVGPSKVGQLGKARIVDAG